VSSPGPSTDPAPGAQAAKTRTADNNKVATKPFPILITILLFSFHCDLN
jgi:hypothetical protein